MLPGKYAGEGHLHPQIWEKKYFSGKHHNIRAVDIFLEEGRTGTLYFFTVFCFSFHVYIEYSFEC